MNNHHFQPAFLSTTLHMSSLGGKLLREWFKTFARLCIYNINICCVYSAIVVLWWFDVVIVV